MTRQITLRVNENPINLDYFVEGFVDHTVSGIIAALKGTGEIVYLDVAIDRENVSVILNGADVPVNLFASKIIRNTLTGLVSSLKGVDVAEKIAIAIQR
ncbi:MAG: hypothetical protein V3R92_02660 [Dehalococcoidales bacterium]